MDNGKSKRITKKIKVFGIVQGVGFRPLVYRIAKKSGITGTVRNVGGYVEILATGEEEAINLFREKLCSDESSGCEIVKCEVLEHSTMEFKDFIIVNSGESEQVSIIPPDLPVCPECQKELMEVKDRRYRNPFISCMTCGPRYTIIEELPYDREHTTMVDFEMCPECNKEYISPEHRRFHAQTISCNECGPYLIFHKTTGKEETQKEEAQKEEAQKEKAQLVDSQKAENQNIEEQNLNLKSQEKLVNKRVDLQLNISVKSIDIRNAGINKTITHSLNFNKKSLEEAISIIKSGGIIALKGIGGYHLVCSPFEEDTVINLRKLKGRDEKPFAVMFRSMEQIMEYCYVSAEEKALLESKARPIVLLYIHNNTMAPSTNKGSIYCGAFLPYTPLQMLLTCECGPLIMTSANLSGQPIIKDDSVMLSLQSPYLDGILSNPRRIVRSVDDSVAKVIDGKPQLIRRSRGYVPYPVFIAVHQQPLSTNQTPDSIHKDCIKSNTISDTISDTISEPAIFAAGGDLKTAFCLYKNGGAVVSQYFGDLEEENIMKEYITSHADLVRLLKISPDLAVCDLHPNYYSTGYVKSLGIPVLQVQHHHAHIASVMAEHELKERVIGIAFDGTGYGTDGNVWGGEFLICEGAEFIRAAKLQYTRMLGGDESMRDAKKTATCYLLEAGLEEMVKDERKDLVKAAMKHKINTINTSSMGRLFDAVASILDINHINRYEGECAALLEGEAVLAAREGKRAVELFFAFYERNEIIEIDPNPVLEALCRLRYTEDKGALALGFHYALAEVTGIVCEILRDKYGSNTVALSGGVFQNTVLTQHTLNILRQKNFQVYTNLAVPPNDGGISLGQTYIGLQKARKQ